MLLGGTTVKSFTMMNLDTHLRKHKEIYQEFTHCKKAMSAAAVVQPQNQSATSASPRQISFAESNNHTRTWSASNVRALVDEMIAHDSHSWSIVSDTGFLKLLKVLESLCNKKFISC